MGDADTPSDADTASDAATDADTASDTATDASTSEPHQEPDSDLGTDPSPTTQPQSESVTQPDTDTARDISDGPVRDADTGLDLNPISDPGFTMGSGEQPNQQTEASSPDIGEVDSVSDTSAAAGAASDRDTVERSQLGGAPGADVTETADPQRGKSETLVGSADISGFVFIGNFDAEDDSGFTVDLERDRDTETLPEAGSSDTPTAGESSIDDPFARLQTDSPSDEDQDTSVRDREEVFSQLDTNTDSLSQLDTAEPVETDLFEEVGVDAIDPETVWDGLGSGDEPEPSEKTQPVDTGEDSDHVISKRQYCQQCPHFSGPPATVCEHNGTTIVSVVDPGKFRVRNCPIVEKDAEETDQTR